MPKFSIIVPIYKVEKYVSQCIESILAQTYKDFEILCVDDCGNDGSIKIVENFAQISTVVAKKRCNAFQLDVVLVVMVDVIQNIVQYTVAGRITGGIHYHFKLLG